MIEWNSHRIRPSKMAETPKYIVCFSGTKRYINQLTCLKSHITDNYLSFQFLFIGNENYLHATENNAIQALDAFHSSSRLVSPEFVELANTLIQEHNLPYPSNFRNSLELYFSLIHLIDCYF